MRSKNNAAGALSKICKAKSLTKSEAIAYLCDVYELERIEEIIGQIKVKHLKNEITAPQKAALRILATYINIIC